MAKGDAKKVDTAINAATNQSNVARTGLATTGQAGYTQAQKQGQETRNLAQNTLGQAGQNYSSFLSAGPTNDYTEALNNLRGASGTYRGFADSGGFSPEDMRNFRERSNAAIPAMYRNAREEAIRANTAQGGYGGGLGATLAHLTRQGSQAAGANAVSTEAALADAIRSGRLSGAAGLTGVGTAMGNLTQGQEQQRLAAMSGLTNVGNALTSLYGTQDPSMAWYNAMMNNQAGQEGTAGNLINARISGSQIPSNFQQAIGNIGGVLGLAGKIGGAVAPLTGTAGNLAAVGKTAIGGLPMPASGAMYSNLPPLTSANPYDQYNLQMGGQ